MEIRKATPQDFEKMLFIWSECISATCHFLTTSEIKKLEKIFEEKHLVDPEIQYFVQAVDGEVFGFACIKGKDLLFSPVDPRLFGKGLGEKMIEFLFREHGIDTTYVYSSDMHSLAFYTALGFVVEDKIEDIFFDNPYEINKLKLLISPVEAADKIAAKGKTPF
ncbi:acetyltransferase [Candidatus Francisella endociliophora]|uniref:Acetyltransferase n=1 Tax=Candidatus Francisella endociliophora TaxID=653937 RepID=A0A097ER65_9GAMM|nr:GNAT family N-acetyltransferase [Francisella sp. FSC1006]AIT10066.1 acetyltransferase [Francisella sp. FSC1006]